MIKRPASKTSKATNSESTLTNTASAIPNNIWPFFVIGVVIGSIAITKAKKNSVQLSTSAEAGPNNTNCNTNQTAVNGIARYNFFTR